MALVLVVLAVLSWFVINVMPLQKLGDTNSAHVCSVGDVIQNQHIKCICTENLFYSCVEVEYSNFKNNTVETSNYKLSCHSNKVYVKQSLICMCNKNGTWPHKKCGTVFKSLPQKALIKNKCEPDSYVQIDCNICRCDSNGNIDKDHCTKNECDNNKDATKHRRFTDGTKLYGDCECRNWYSLAPCQFCYCLKNNKLVCNTGTSFTTSKMYLQLGSYNLHICGKKLIKQLTDLIHDNEAVLRQGDETNMVSSTMPSVSSVITEPNHVVLNVSKKPAETYDIKENIGHNSYNTESGSSSQSDENKSEHEINIENKQESKTYNHVGTQLPYQDSPNEETFKIAPGRQSVNSDESSDSGNEFTDADKKANLRIAITKPSHKPDKHFVKELEGHFEFNLPIILDKVFKMATRKSMVTLNSNKTCVPGAIEAVACNTCFCLKNAKMLCTDNKCSP